MSSFHVAAVMRTVIPQTETWQRYNCKLVSLTMLSYTFSIIFSIAAACYIFRLMFSISRLNYCDIIFNITAVDS